MFLLSRAWDKEKENKWGRVGVEELVFGILIYMNIKSRYSPRLDSVHEGCLSTMSSCTLSFPQSKTHQGTIITNTYHVNCKTAF